MSKIRKISGFPEWLPGQKLVEERIVDQIRQIYRQAGFVPIETAAVELLDTLQAKGSVDKEIYTLRRLHAEGDEKEELALHFDLTVPFSRYVAQHLSELSFPFKRYQLQKVWRGERPQKGRYREFYQFDIDIIARDELPISCDAEALDIFAEALAKIGLPKYQIRINDRRILLGFYESLGLNEQQKKQTVLIVDKIDKIGADGVSKLLSDELKLDMATINQILKFSEARLSPKEAQHVLNSMNIDNQVFSSGVNGIGSLLDLLQAETLEKVVIDLSLARGLDYYTGLIVEVRMLDYPEFGSIGSGGRYEDLASEFISQKLPGVGFSIGISRILGFLFDQGIIDCQRACLTKVLVSVYNESQRKQCLNIAKELRELGVATEVFFKSPKLGKQLDYADSKGIPYVIFISENGIQAKDLRTKDQFNVTSLAEFAAKIKQL
jgi:histidyl-tRNA synthetase